MIFFTKNCFYYVHMKTFELKVIIVSAAELLLMKFL